MISFLEGQSKATKTPCFQTYKERSDRLKALLVRGSSGRIGDSGHGRAIMFWSSMRKILDKNEYQQFKNWNNSRCKAEQRAYNKNVFGLTSEGFKKDVAARNNLTCSSRAARCSGLSDSRRCPVAAESCCSRVARCSGLSASRRCPLADASCFSRAARCSGLSASRRCPVTHLTALAEQHVAVDSQHHAVAQ
jgi:hypothetical protein